MFKKENETKNEEGMCVNTIVCVSSVTTVTHEPYNMERPLQGELLVQADDDGNEDGFLFVEHQRVQRTRNRQVYKSPHVSLRITKDGNFSGTFHFNDLATEGTSVRAEIEQALESASMLSGVLAACDLIKAVKEAKVAKAKTETKKKKAA